MDIGYFECPSKVTVFLHNIGSMRGSMSMKPK